MPQHRTGSDAPPRTSAPTDGRAAKLRVLVADDMAITAGLLQGGLHDAGLVVELAMTATETMDRISTFTPDILVTSLAVADAEWRDLIRHVTEHHHCGVIALTRDDAHTVRLAGQETGVDDFLVRPVRVRELAARIRALHRRRGRPAGIAPKRIFVEHATGALSGGSRARAPTLLSQSEWAALEILLDAQGASVSREWLSRMALKRAFQADDPGLDTLIVDLRRKLAAHGASAGTIQGVRRQGYVIPDSTMFQIVYGEEN